MFNIMKRFAKDDSGATAIEYGLIAALVAVVLIVSLQTLGTNLKAAFVAVGDALKITAAP